MKQLLDMGFTKAGCWIEKNEIPVFELNEHEVTENVLYAFVVENDLKYIGKTTQKLKKRMYGYQNPGQNQSTNINVNEKILSELLNGKSVDIYVFPDSGQLNFGGFRVNLAAGLEDNIISTLKPVWNKRGSKSLIDTNRKKNNSEASSLSKNELTQVRFDSESPPIYNLILQKTYFKQGFFNIPRKFDIYIGKDEAPIEIQLDNNKSIQGKINRSANNNGTARIMGTSILKNWFQSRFEVKDTITVEFLSKYHVRLR